MTNARSGSHTLAALRLEHVALRAELDRMREQRERVDCELAVLSLSVSQLRQDHLLYLMDLRAEVEVLMLAIQAAHFGPKGDNPVFDALLRLHESLLAGLDAARTRQDKQALRQFEIHLHAAQRIRERLFD